MGKRSNLLVAVGLAVFLLGGALVLVVLRNGDDTGAQPVASAGAGSVAVVVATRDIPAGTSGADMVSQGMVATRPIAGGDKPADAVTSPSQLVGQVVSLPVKKGEPLRSGSLRTEQIKIPDGKQAVAVQVDYVAGVAGQVGPGDIVNLYANVLQSSDPAQKTPFTRLLLSNVEVLKVSAAPPPSTPATPTTVPPQVAPVATSGTPLIFLVALDANQAEKLIFSAANQTQKLYATLVPKDQPPAQTPGRNDATLFAG